MKIDFNDYDLSEFVQKEGEFCGIPAILITPRHLGASFTQKNKIFRSSIWSKDGNLLSSSFFKFPNWGENEENFPLPTSLDGCSIINKEDGSTCILDYVNGRHSLRSRGTFAASTLDNGSEFYQLKSLYPKVYDYIIEHPNYSIIMEILSPTNIIVLPVEKLDFILIGIVNKNDYSLVSQARLDQIATELDLKRPVRYMYAGIGNLSINDLANSVKEWKMLEGCVLYSGGDQVLHKLKSDWYKNLHFLKSKFHNFNSILDFWFESGKPSKEDFIQIIKNLDFELYNMAAANIEELFKKKENAVGFIDEIGAFVLGKEFVGKSRKESAALILSLYPKHSSIAFSILDGREINDKILAQLILELL